MATTFGEKNPWPEHSALLGQRSSGVIWGQPGVKLLRNALWPPNLVERTPDHSVMHCWVQRSCRGRLGSSRGQFSWQCLMAIKFGGKNPWPKCNAFIGVKGHAVVIRGQPEVKLLRSVLWPPNLVGRILDQSVMHCWDQKSWRGQLGSSRGQFT